MRRTYLLVLFWGTLSAAMAQPSLPQNAPPPPPPGQSEFSKAFDNAFANLDKSGITSGIIYDRVFPAANLREAGNPSSAGHFKQAQAELYYANYNYYTELSPEDVRSLIWESRQQGITPIGVIVEDFQVCNTDAIELDNNNQYRLRSGYSNGQLYQTSQAVVASVLSTSIGYTSTKFQLPLWATFTNTDATITSVTIDFGEGGQIKTLTPGGGPVDVFYNQGEKILNYTINLSDGTQRTAVSTLTVGDSRGGAVYNNITNGATDPAVNGPINNYMEPPNVDRFGNIERLSIEADEAFQG